MMNSAKKMTFSKRLLALTLCSGLLLGATTIPTKSALANSAPDIQVSREGDVALSCNQLSNEASYMRDIIEHAQGITKDSKMAGAGINVVKAIGGFLIGSATGGIGVVAAGFLLGEAAGNRAEEATEIQNLAEQRHSFMRGIYIAKSCEGPFQTLPAEPAPIDIAAIEPAGGSKKPRYNE